MSFRLPHWGGLASARAISEFAASADAPTAAPPRRASRRVIKPLISLLPPFLPSVAREDRPALAVDVPDRSGGGRRLAARGSRLGGRAGRATTPAGNRSGRPTI